MITTGNPIRVTCSFCGSTDVSRDGWAQWDERDQRWVLRAVFDAAFCHQCECKTSLNEMPVETSKV